ncbi:MAG: hypothetical protein Q7T53_12025 [Deltaproteobacteria bacterium]|nr:hypothetical protein [Deltaproteobacteria bacterium]
MRFIRSGLVAVLGMGVIACSGSASAADKSIKYTRHNLSSSGLYDVKAVSENQICKFCHAPHNADSREAPLWNRNDTTATFTMATTRWVNWGRAAQTGADSQPTTISKKCLSCHDGSIAIGEIRNGGPIAMATSTKLDGDGSLKDNNPFGPKDLRGGHVISFKYKTFYDNCLSDGGCAEGRFKSWETILVADQRSMFDRNGAMQCHTCHDPHTDRCNDSSKTIGKDPLWRKICDHDGGFNDGNGSLCNTCHNTFAEYTAPNLMF